jgi:CHRD domain/PEP-CTERM motif
MFLSAQVPPDRFVAITCYHRDVMKKLLPLLLLIALPCISQAQILFFHADLDGAQSSTPSAGTGFANAWLNVGTNELTFNLVWTGLGSLTTNGHIHRGLPGVAGPVTVPFPGLPLGQTFGAYNRVFTLTAPLSADLIAGLDYVNIHTSQFPAGEIRGQLIAAPNPVPEPSTYALSGAALLVFLAFRRARQSRAAA